MVPPVWRGHCKPPYGHICLMQCASLWPILLTLQFLPVVLRLKNVSLCSGFMVTSCRCTNQRHLLYYAVLNLTKIKSSVFCPVTFFPELSVVCSCRCCEVIPFTFDLLSDTQVISVVSSSVTRWEGCLVHYCGPALANLVTTSCRHSKATVSYGDLMIIVSVTTASYL